MKHLCVIQAPIDTYSGYGANSRDKVKAIIDSKKNEWDIVLIPVPWGNTPVNYIKENNEKWGFLEEYIIKAPITKQPEIFIQISVPNEFQKAGKFSVGITAGIETTLCDASWIEGVNRMDLTLVSSEHALNVFKNSKFQAVDNSGNVVGLIELNKPIEVVGESFDEDVFKYIPSEQNILNDTLSKVKENFCFLFTGHWLPGMIREDRKNVGLLVELFLDTFRGKSDKPALILKTSSGPSSYMDRDSILSRVDQIKEHLLKKNPYGGEFPNVYLFHGDVDEKTINHLYNHDKVKCMVSLTKGEGFGRPLLEFSVLKKPIITTGYSGHLDFLKHATLLEGQLSKVHGSAVVPNMILAESEWFSVSEQAVTKALEKVFKNYDKFETLANKQRVYTKENFNYHTISRNFINILSKYLPEFPKYKTISLPDFNAPSLDLSKINKK